MSILVETKYAQLLSTRLPLYRRKGSGSFCAEFRCIICGDSKKKSTKRRGYLYVNNKDNHIYYKCHNCGANHSLRYFLKQYCPDLYKDFSFDIFKEKKAVYEADSILNIKKPVVETKGGIFNGVKRISQLSHEHPAKKYIVDRKIPPEFHCKLYFTKNFQEWINSIIPGKFEKVPSLDPRIIIPFFDKDGNVHTVQGRAISSKQFERYITIRLDENQPKVFGAERIDENYRVWCVEGPFDSLFIPNAVAMAGADISLTQLCEYLGIVKNRLVLVMDNEPRSKEIIKRMRKAIDDGFKIVIWPRSMKHKDINAAIMSGISLEDMQNMLNKNVYNGLSAHTKLAAWSKLIGE